MVGTKIDAIVIVHNTINRVSNDTVLYAIATKNLCKTFSTSSILFVGTRCKESGFLDAPEKGEALVG